MRRIVTKLPRLLTVLCAASVLSGCYVLQAATGQLAVMSRSRPISQVVTDPRTPLATRDRLVLAGQARDFAIRELALPDGKSFREYADLGRPFAVWNVVAAPEFSVEPRRWCFPVAGCVAYRGYFRESRARSLARRLAARGDDVMVGGVATYSTLGHLPDPLFNTMLGWTEARFVGTIFHELAHERLYVPGDSEFNEAFATVVEQEGVRRWLLSEQASDALAAYEASRRREVEFSELLRAARSRLALLYDGGSDEGSMRIEKEREFGRLKYRYEVAKRGWGGYAGYDAWFARVLNNAHLAAVATYQDCVPGLRRELEAAGSLPAFYARAEQLSRLASAERRTAVCSSGAGFQLLQVCRHAGAAGGQTCNN